MSQVISFRLDRDNPREAQALHILAAWQERGYSLRHILTEALIRLDSEENTDKMPAQNLDNVVTQLEALLAELRSGVWNQQPVNPTQSDIEELSQAFFLSVSKGIQTRFEFGVRLRDHHTMNLLYRTQPRNDTAIRIRPYVHQHIEGGR